MELYRYTGPVMEFGVCISNHWEAITYAVSEHKAKANFAYQFKIQNNRLPTTNISLPGKIRKLSS